MSPWIKYKCGCIEGPIVSEGSRCEMHGQGGVATLIDCPKGRPIRVWITNNVCDAISLCPTIYDDCEYKHVRRQSPAQGSMI